MYSTALNSFRSLNFVVCDLKHDDNSAFIDKETEADIHKIEQKIKAAFISKHSFDAESQKIIPILFDFRVKGMKKLRAEKRTIPDTIDENIISILHELNANARFKYIAGRISEAMASNRKLTELFSQNGLYDETKFNAIADSLNFKSFLFFLNMLPDELRKAVLELTLASLNLEFVLIASVLVIYSKLHVDYKLKEFQKFSSDVSHKFIAYANYFIEKNGLEKILDEKFQWKTTGNRYFRDAHAEYEPDYNNISVREPNPDYSK